MKRKNINRLNSAISTTNFCDATAAETASITAFAVLVLLIKSKIIIVQSFNQLCDTPTSGVTLNTKALRQSMMEHTYVLGNAIFSYAAGLATPDEDLMAQSKLTKDTLENLSKEECATECDRIQQLAASLGVLIAPYGASATAITDTGSLVTLYLTSYGDPRAAVVTRSNAKKQADIVLKDIMANLLKKQLDPMANTLRFTNTSWWNQYHLSREVIDLGSTFTKLRTRVNDEEDDPIKSAAVSLLQGGVVIYTKKTNAAGEMSITKIQPGDYDLLVQKPGFTEYLETGVHFAPGSEKIHQIVLLAIGSGNPNDPAGFEMKELVIPAGGSLNVPVNEGPEPIPSTFEIYLLANGNLKVCTTNLPANPCTDGYQLMQNIAFQGLITTLGIDLTKTHVQFTNTGDSDVTLRIGTKV